MRRARDRRTVLLAGCLAAFVAMSATAQNDREQPRQITVTAQGQAVAAPDLAVVTLSVETTATTAQEAAQDNATKADRVVKEIKAKLSGDDKISTTGYQLTPRYEGRKPGSSAPPEIAGYVAQNQVRVELHDLEQVGAVLDAALAAGANRASGLSFQLQDRRDYVRQALDEAGKDARAQAESIAAALGVVLGEVLNASTNIAFPYPRPMMQMARVAMAEAAPPTPVEAGDLTIEATLTVSFAIGD